MRLARAQKQPLYRLCSIKPDAHILILQLSRQTLRAVAVQIIKLLQDPKPVHDPGDYDSHMHDLVARSKQIEPTWKPSLRKLIAGVRIQARLGDWKRRILTFVAYAVAPMELNSSVNMM